MSKWQLGRPRKHEYPEPIDDTSKNFAKAVLATPPSRVIAHLPPLPFTPVVTYVYNSRLSRAD